MAYIKSTDIQLFPSAFRGQYDTPENDVFNPASRLTTEYNLTTLSARASRFHQSYVLDYKAETGDETIIFNIKGYLFSVKMATFLATLAPETQQIWAKIKLEDIAPDDINNTVDTNPVLKPVEESGTLLDRRLTAEGDFLFLGLFLETDDPTSELTSEEHTLLILEKTGDEWDVPAKSYFRMSAKEISDSGDEAKSIDEEFNVEEINVGKINGLTITPASSAVLTIAEGEELSVNGSVTLAGTGTATFNTNLTVAGPHNITLETDDANRTLKVSGSNKELAGAGSVLTMGGDLTTEGAHTTKFKTTEDTTLTLPTTGTLATIAEPENLTNKTINGLIVDTTTGTLDIANGKKLEINDNITVGTNAITLESGKSLTMQYAGLTVGASNGTGTVNIKTSGATERSLTLTGSPSLSGITTTGNGTLALNKSLTVDDANKTLAGAGTSLTIDNNLDIAGTTGQITLGKNAHTLAFTTTNNTEVTLPTAGTLATTAESEAFINKTYEGLTLTAESSGFSISGGTSSKKLTVPATYTLDDACAMGVKDVTTEEPTAISSSGENLITERAVYYGLPRINANHSYKSDTNIFAPTSGGDYEQLLVGNGTPNAPIWANPNTITVGNATKTAFTNNSFYGPITISSSGDTPAPLLLVGRTYQIYISFEGNPYANKWSLGLIRIPGGLDESVFTMLSAGGHYLQFSHSTVEEHSSVTCWAKGPDNNISKTGCNLYYKLIS